MVASTCPSAPLITVFGSTGNQGGSVIDHLISSSKPYRIRAVTRDSSKPLARKLEETGCEVIQAELGNKDQVEHAVKGAEIVFTYIWSGTESVSKVSRGQYTKVEHFDTKAQLTDLARSEGLPVITVSAAMYMENFLGMMAPRKQEDGTYVFALPIPPTTILHLIHTRRDYGAYVLGALESGKVDALKGEVLACAEEIAVEDVAKQWGEETPLALLNRECVRRGSLRSFETVNNVKTLFFQLPVEQFQAQAGDDLTQMFQWFQDFGYYGGKDIAPSQEVLRPDVKVDKWRDFVKRSDWSKVLN
ncbi:hypothetical protein QFC19_001545 [Naganishia cerealis]|uniref:Uncharacterized protein n=1 Tax=Naganishia cerealis TaxID=610337 RepID=A0ACC2WGH4_9TREE|nr:hypothetical protein QFC19_001545 [Naganishia cerealis]